MGRRAAASASSRWLRAGSTVWTANEEALEADGPRATGQRGTTVRVTRFEAGQLAGQWAYVTRAQHRRDSAHRQRRWCRRSAGVARWPAARPRAGDLRQPGARRFRRFRQPHLRSGGSGRHRHLVETEARRTDRRHGLRPSPQAACCGSARFHSSRESTTSRGSRSARRSRTAREACCSSPTTTSCRPRSGRCAYAKYKDK